MRILALDYGNVHTGAAVCDPSGTIVRPLGTIKQAGSDGGLKLLEEIVAREGVGMVLVGMPVTLAGETGKQARETEAFVARLKLGLEVPVEIWDERFTTKIAAQKGRFSDSDSHSLAACCLLDDYLGSSEYERRFGGGPEKDDDGDA